MSKSKQVIDTTSLPFDPNHLSSLTTKSSQIRYLDSQGLKRGQIAKTLNIRYQWVRNVLITPLKKS
jgi:DNA-binding NarL/FixJ family response regulator